MKMLELVLVGYKRLMLNNIKSITYTPTSLYQLILGTNGSGKSSILYEASALPANPSDYTKNGSKLGRWEHNGSMYVLESKFKSGAKHSFIKDGLELNPGGTGAVQKELAKQEFGLTQDLHNLLIGDELFTEMGPSKRREWLTMLCDTDFSFAMGLYNRVRTAGRDAQGAFKHLSGRLTQETQRLKSLGEVGSWADEAQQLQSELEMLFTNKSNRNLIGGKEKIRTIQDYECRLAEKCLAIGNPLPSQHSFNSLDDLQAAVQAANTETDLLSHSLTWTYEALEDLLKLERTVESSGVGDLTTAEQQLVELEATKQDYISKIKRYHYNPDQQAHAAILSIESIQDDLNNVLLNIPCNAERRFTKQHTDEAKQSLRDLRPRLGTYLNQIAKEEATLEHIAGLCSTECPNCKHSWLPGESEDRRIQSEKSIAHFKQEVENTEGRLAALTSYLEAAEEFSGYFVRFRGLVSSNPSLRAFWDKMLECDAINNESEKWVLEFTHFKQDVHNWFEIAKLEEQALRLTLAIDAMRSISGIGKLSEHIADNQQKISDITDQLVKAKARSIELKTATVKIEDIYSLNKQLEQMQTDKQEAFADYVVELRDQAINDVTKQHQNRLAFLNAKLSEKKTLEDLVEDLSEGRVAVEREMLTYKLLADELSPVDGLIADQLIGFITSFTEHLNAIIANVWTYDMVVKPCGLESGELDYKFPMQIKSEDHNVPDISKGSKGQVEMINFAFKLIVMFYLRLTDYPLYLDELGHSFDEQHRINVMNFIKDLVESKGFSQVFMISHYASSHGAFTQAEVLVMDAANIAVPTKHNQHAILC